MLYRKEYATIGKALRDFATCKDIAEIRIDFYDVPMEKRNQIETAANEFLNLAEKILTEDQVS